MASTARVEVDCVFVDGNKLDASKIEEIIHDHQSNVSNIMYKGKTITVSGKFTDAFFEELSKAREYHSVMELSKTSLNISSCIMGCNDPKERETLTKLNELIVNSIINHPTDGSHPKLDEIITNAKKVANSMNESNQ